MLARQGPGIGLGDPQLPEHMHQRLPGDEPTILGFWECSHLIVNQVSQRHLIEHPWRPQKVDVEQESGPKIPSPFCLASGSSALGQVDGHLEGSTRFDQSLEFKSPNTLRKPPRVSRLHFAPK